MPLQTVLRALFPPSCLMCEERVEGDFGLCPSCWSQTVFINAPSCETCGTPLPGPVEAGLKCDDCIGTARPWTTGRAALVYSDLGRKMVLALKHGDRTDIARGAAQWMLRRVEKSVTPQTVIVPVPLHWRRLAKRRYNQAALLASAMAQLSGARYAPMALVRHTATAPLDGKSKAERFEALSGCIGVHSKHGGILQDAQILLVDDVMTSGATLAACADAVLGHGARRVDVCAMARVAKDA